MSTLLDLLMTFLDTKAMEGYNWEFSSKMHNNYATETNFIEFVYFSPMHRAFEPLDLIVRKMGICIQSGYTERMG